MIRGDLIRGPLQAYAAGGIWAADTLSTAALFWKPLCNLSYATSLNEQSSSDN